MQKLKTKSSLRSAAGAEAIPNRDCLPAGQAGFVALRAPRNDSNRCWLVAFIFAFYALNFFGCATAPSVKPPLSAGVPGIYHRVEKGQTLWRISKIYSVDLEELARINRIPDASSIEIGQLIFIPNRKTVVNIPQASSSDDFIWPLKGKVIATFGSTVNNMVNKGLNIQPYDNKDVVASRNGKVVFCADNFGSFGKMIIIDHGDGLSSAYARNSVLLAKAGENVRQGALIAKAGSAGRDKNTYLHFQIRKGPVPQNPYYYLP